MNIFTHHKQTLIARYANQFRLSFTNLTMKDNWISKHENVVADVQISLISIH